MTEKDVRKSGQTLRGTVSNGETGTADPTLPRPVDRARQRIAGDFYKQTHVQEKIVRALLEMLDVD
jgi:hypothetical protein